MTLSSNAEIITIIDSYDREIKALKTESLRMCWYMRGGISYKEILEMSIIDREIIANIIKENLEIAKESKMPFW